MSPGQLRRILGLGLIASSTFALGCGDSTETGLVDLDLAFGNKGKKPHKGDPPTDQTTLAITISGPSSDALQSDGGVYLEDGNGLATRLSGANGNLMFNVQNSGGDRMVQISALGPLPAGPRSTRIYTNSSPDLRDLSDGGSAQARMFVEFSEGGVSYQLRYGTDCTGDDFETGSGDRPMSEWVTVVRNGDTWTVSGSPAYLCGWSGKGRKRTLDPDMAVSAPFQFTMVGQG